MRRVLYIPRNQEGFFHRFGMESSECNGGVAVNSIGIIELDGGEVICALPYHIKFLDSILRVCDPIEEIPPKTDNFHRGVSNYDFSIRTANCLDFLINEKFGRAITTAEEFCKICKPKEFLLYPNVGRKSLRELTEAFSENGINWSDDDPE